MDRNIWGRKMKKFLTTKDMNHAKTGFNRREQRKQRVSVILCSLRFETWTETFGAER
jgi:hypothetical protein